MKTAPRFILNGGHILADLQFYEVDATYINYLLQTDARVPHIDYSATSPHDKFLCGIVLTVNGHDYFAPISSFTVPQRTNVLIRNAQGRVLASIRLSFMIPIPPGVASLKNIDAEQSQSYKFLLNNELRFCNRNADYIRQRAKIVYEAVTAKRIPLMIKNCCDFKALETACAEYMKMRALEKREGAAPVQTNTTENKVSVSTDEKPSVMERINVARNTRRQSESDAPPREAKKNGPEL